MSKKLLVIGSNSIHIYNFIALVHDYFDEVLLLTNQHNSAYDIKTVEINFRLGINSFYTIKKINAIINEFQPTTIHIHQANSYAFFTLLALKGYACQTVLTAWGSDILVNPKKSFLFKMMAQYILKRADCITADSDTVLKAAQSLVTKKLDTHNINFGIEMSQCEQPKENLIYSNRLHKPLYNIDKIIRSFHQFMQTHTDWKLIIAGSGEQTDHLKKLVEELDLKELVAFVGWVDASTNYDYYCRSKIYVSVPQSDSISLSLVEGVVCGCVPFVSNLPANRELVSEGMGFIVEDIEHIPFQEYENIDPIVFKTRQAEIQQHFSKELNSQKYIALYERNYEN